MNQLADAFAWITDPAHWSGDGSIPQRLTEHVGVTLLVLLIAAAIALPLGAYVGHTGRGTHLAISVTGGLRALPTLGLLTLFGLWLGIGLAAPVLALVVLAIAPMLASTYAGFESVDRATIDAARGIGMSRREIVTKVELPLALPIIVGGIRSATLQVVATATLAAYTADVGLGRFIFAGLKTRDYAEMLGGAVLVVTLALIVDLALAGLQRLAVPAGVRHLTKEGSRT